MGGTAKIINRKAGDFANAWVWILILHNIN